MTLVNLLHTQIQTCTYILVHTYICSYIHACTNKSNSLANLQDLIIPTLAAIIIGNTS